MINSAFQLSLLLYFPHLSLLSKFDLFTNGNIFCAHSISPKIQNNARTLRQLGWMILLNPFIFFETKYRVQSRGIGVPRPPLRGRRTEEEKWGLGMKEEGRKAVIRSWSRTDGRTGPAATRAALLLSSEQHILHSTTLNWEGTERDICSTFI